MTCNVTELHHHIGWFEDTLEVFCIDAEGRRYEIVALLDEGGSPVLKIQAVAA
jgi:hypothetical protein